MAYRRMVGMGNGTVVPIVAPLDYQSPNSCSYGLNGCGCSSCGMGIFETGIDFSGWGWPEWTIAILGGYMVLSTVFTTKRAVSGIAKIPGERRKRKAAHYRKMASELTSKKKKGGGLF